MDQKNSDTLRAKVLSFQELNVPPRLLLGPGPSNADPRVLRALSSRQVGHLDPSFLKLMVETQELMRYAMQTNNKVTFAVSGTGSASMEAGFANLIEQGDKVLIFNSGYFACRMVDMAERYGGVVTSVDKPWGENFTLDEMVKQIQEHKPKVVGIVHADTSTGVLQPVEGVSEAVRAVGGYLIVDTVTSLGGLPLYVDKWGIDVAYSGSQKCLSCPPGISPLSVSDRAMDAIMNRKTKTGNWYLDLALVGKYWGPTRSYHHTAPINMTYAMRESLRIVAEEGLEERWARHRRNAEELWAGLEGIGLTMAAPLEMRLPSLTTVRVPDGVDPKAVQKILLEEFNLEIGGGLGQLAGQVWRIGLMGYNSRKESVLTVVNAFDYALKKVKAQ